MPRHLQCGSWDNASGFRIRLNFQVHGLRDCSVLVSSYLNARSLSPHCCLLFGWGALNLEALLDALRCRARHQREFIRRLPHRWLGSVFATLSLRMLLLNPYSCLGVVLGTTSIVLQLLGRGLIQDFLELHLPLRRILDLTSDQPWVEQLRIDAFLHSQAAGQIVLLFFLAQLSIMLHLFLTIGFLFFFFIFEILLSYVTGWEKRLHDLLSGDVIVLLLELIDEWINLFRDLIN